MWIRIVMPLCYNIYCTGTTHVRLPSKVTQTRGLFQILLGIHGEIYVIYAVVAPKMRLILCLSLEPCDNSFVQNRCWLEWFLFQVLVLDWWPLICGARLSES
jgi:hypothetical protein